MQPKSNKSQELTHLRSFGEAYGDCPPLEALIERDGEKPDFRFQRDGRILGVEHTRLFRPPPDGFRLPRQAQESIWDAIHQQARFHWEAEGWRPISVKVFTSPRIELVKSDIPRLVDGLLEVLVNAAVDIFRLSDYESLSIKYPLPSEFSHVRVSAMPEGMDVWNGSDSAWGYDWTIDEIQSVITAKNGKVRNYRHRCDEVWLLIMYDFGPLSAWGDVTDDVRGHQFDSEFDRTLMHSIWNRTIDELIS